MGKIQKSSKCQRTRCKLHNFDLKALQKNLHFGKLTRVKFCPKFNKQFGKWYNSHPLTNIDGKSYTPLFILQDEKVFYDKNDNKILASHLKRISECVSKDSLVSKLNFLIYVAKHNRKRQFCSVCKQTYHQYLEHIGEESHRQCIRKNKYNQFIIDLCVKIQKTTKIQPQHVEVEDLSTDEVDKFIQRIPQV